MKIIDHFKGIYGIYPNLLKENGRMSTCNRLDLQTIGSQPFMPKNLPDIMINIFNQLEWEPKDLPLTGDRGGGKIGGLGQLV